MPLPNSDRSYPDWKPVNYLLEESIAAYKKGVELVQLCTSRLEKVENQIKILDKELLKPFSSDKSDIE